LVDLDDFKAINDAFSHDDGDDFLKTIAQRFNTCLRESDTIARVGGDEFAVLLEDIDQKNVGIVAQKVNQVLSEPVEIKGNTIVSTASIGVSIFPQDGDSIQVLLKNADLAMYQAKERKNSFQFYNREMAVKVEKQMEMTGYLRLALQDNIFQLHYQPQVDSSTGKVTGVEALLRLPHPTREWISPGEFIPLAEKTGLITAIDEWVLRTAGRKIRELRDGGSSGVMMSVNLSNRQLGQPSLFAILEEVLRENDLAPGCLGLEISESSVFQNLDATVSALSRLKSMGVKLAIDDFGTGYASLNYLTRFPLDTIKIDLTFTQKVLSSKSDAAIVAGVIAIANRLGLEIIVEGVEKRGQLEFYSDLNCHVIQGYFYSPAVPGSELEDVLSRGFSPFRPN
ncbi:MAG TPA: bifunctional diguanylate cyclase/phosphodiesterase, partial [Anaerolineales bacterium]|nr:bifunctional diguanylate cyclase/phosphodiesterase [Anaerolineales bacterium]